MDHLTERAWLAGEAEVAALMGSINASTARLVVTVRVLLDTDGWTGWGIKSPEHWLTWKAAVSPQRAEDLVRAWRPTPAWTTSLSTFDGRVCRGLMRSCGWVPRWPMGSIRRCAALAAGVIATR